MPQLHSCFFWDLAGFLLARLSGILIISCQKKKCNVLYGLTVCCDFQALGLKWGQCNKCWEKKGGCIEECCCVYKPLFGDAHAGVKTRYYI